MAGDWIKLRHDLADDPAVVRMSRVLGMDRDSVLGKLFRLWGWADRHTVDGRACDIGGEQFVDEHLGAPGFARAMVSVGWLVVDGDCFDIPKFDRHNGESAKKRALSAVRKQVFRSRNADSVPQRNALVPKKVGQSCDKSVPREEKRREENKHPSDVATTETRKPRSRSLPSDSISWDSSGGWSGIAEADRAAWRAAYPACDIAGELARMGEWLKANPAKAKKSRWRQFVTAWLTRSQDRGGGQVSKRPGLGFGPMTLDEKIEAERRESRKKKTWRAAPPGCPEELAGRFFNRMLSQEEFETNQAEALEIHRQRLQEARTRPIGGGAACPDVLTTNGRENASQSVTGP
jgi:hypothetical protein